MATKNTKSKTNVSKSAGKSSFQFRWWMAVEAYRRGVAPLNAAPQPGHDSLTDPGNGREEIGDDGSAPEAHLSPGQHVAEEARGHHQEIDDDAEDPEHLARRRRGRRSRSVSTTVHRW